MEHLDSVKERSLGFIGLPAEQSATVLRSFMTIASLSDLPILKYLLDFDESYLAEVGSRHCFSSHVLQSRRRDSA